MTRRQKSGWALGYSALYILTPLAYLFFHGNALLILPGSSVLTGVIFIGFSEIPGLKDVTTVAVLAMLAGLVIAPVCAAFRRYRMLHALMALDVVLHALMIAHGLMEGDSEGTLVWLVPGTIVSIAVLAVTAYVLRRPEPHGAEKSA
ncbi:MAG: hypothetical protein IJE07_08885 [Clostridia bacterium]|nr:hypothetical protein [Clostridia bacterium]